MRKMIVAVIYRNDGKFLVLKRSLNWKGWEFVKGRVEGESDKCALIREIKEETKIRNAKIVYKIPIEIIYHHDFIHGHRTSKQIAYLVECPHNKVRLSFEHSSFRWVNSETAEKLLTHKSHKVFLAYARKYLREQEKSRKKGLIEKLSKKHASRVRFNGKKIFLVFDGKKISYKVIRKTVKDVGEWSRKGPIVYYDKNLDEQAVLPMLVHEAVEKHVAQAYGLNVDTEAHKVATAVEKEFIADKKWRGHQITVARAWTKANRRKIGKTKFY